MHKAQTHRDPRYRDQTHYGQMYNNWIYSDHLQPEEFKPIKQIVISTSLFNRSFNTSDRCLTLRSIPRFAAPPRSCMIHPGHSVIKHLAFVFKTSSSFLLSISAEIDGNLVEYVPPNPQQVSSSAAFTKSRPAFEKSACGASLTSRPLHK